MGGNDTFTVRGEKTPFWFYPQASYHSPDKLFPSPPTLDYLVMYFFGPQDQAAFAHSIFFPCWNCDLGRHFFGSCGWREGCFLDLRPCHGRLVSSGMDGCLGHRWDCSCGLFCCEMTSGRSLVASTMTVQKKSLTSPASECLLLSGTSLVVCFPFKLGPEHWKLGWRRTKNYRWGKWVFGSSWRVERPLDMKLARHRLETQGWLLDS